MLFVNDSKYPHCPNLFSFFVFNRLGEVALDTTVGATLVRRHFALVKEIAVSLELVLNRLYLLRQLLSLAIFGKKHLSDKEKHRQNLHDRDEAPDARLLHD